MLAHLSRGDCVIVDGDVFHPASIVILRTSIEVATNRYGIRCAGSLDLSASPDGLVQNAIQIDPPTSIGIRGHDNVGPGGSIVAKA